MVPPGPPSTLPPDLVPPGPPPGPPPKEAFRFHTVGYNKTEEATPAEILEGIKQNWWTQNEYKVATIVLIYTIEYYGIYTRLLTVY